MPKILPPAFGAEVPRTNTAMTIATATSAMTTGTIGGRVHLGLSSSSLMSMWPAPVSHGSAATRGPVAAASPGVVADDVLSEGPGSGGGFSSGCPIEDLAKGEMLDSVPGYSLLGACRPFLFHSGGEFVRWQRVQDVGLRQPCPSRLQDAKADFFHMRSVVRIRVDHDFHPALSRHPQMPVTEIQPIGIGIKLHRNFVFLCCTQHRLHIVRVAVTPQENSPGRMPNDGDVLVLNGAQQPLSHFGRFLTKMRMDAGNDQIHLLENGIRKV